MALIEDIAQAHQIRETLLNRQAGKWLLTQSNPNEFDYYMIAFELLKSDLSTSKYFIFPILPNSMEYDNTSLTKVNKTAGGVSVLKSSQFNVKDISLSGTFGKNFKVLVGSTSQELVSNFRDDNGNSSIKSAAGGALNAFSATIKTGYGCTKVLEDILESSTQKDEFGGNHFLVFYNLAFNQKLFVEVENQRYSQSLETNMVWNYSLRLKAIGNVEDFIDGKSDIKSTKQLVMDHLIQQGANAAYNKVTSVLSKTYNQVVSSVFS